MNENLMETLKAVIDFFPAWCCATPLGVTILIGVWIRYKLTGQIPE
jgi:hypothetical protein